MEKKYKLNEKFTKKQDRISLSALMMKYIVYWKYFLASAVLSIGVMYLYIQCQNKVYQIDAAVLFNDESGKGRADMAMLQELGFLGGMNANVENEIEVMRSKDLFLNVVEALNLAVTINQREGLKKVNLYPDAPIQVQVSPEILNQIESKGRLRLLKQDGSYLLEGKVDAEEVHCEFNELPATVSLRDGTILITENQLVSNNNWKELYIQIENPLYLASQLTRDVLFHIAQKNGSVVRLVTKNENIALAKDILYNIVDAYNRVSVEAKNETAVSTDNFINERLASLENELALVEQQIEKYKQENKLTDILSESELYLKQIGENVTQKLQIETQINIVSHIRRFVSDPQNEYQLIPNMGITDVGLVKVIDRYNQLILAREKLLRTSSAGNPTIQVANQEIKTVRISIQKGIEVFAHSLEISEQNLFNQEKQMQTRVQAVPKQERELLEISRQQKIKEALYVFLLEKKEENSLTMTLTVPMARMIEKPFTNKKKIAPRSGILYLLALVLALVIPIAVMYVYHLFQVTIRNRNDIEQISDLPVLGELNVEDLTDSQLVVSPGKTDLPNELFRAIRNNLQFVSSIGSKKVITITSNVPGEGKSYVTANLAAMFAISGKRTLLLGLDLRNPQIASIFNLKNIGITNYISGSTDLTRPDIYTSALYPHLDIIPAGPVPINPNEMLMSEKLKDFIEESKKSYDYILIDSAPIGVISDSYLLNDQTDLFVFVTRAQVTHKNMIVDIHKLLDSGHIKNAYLIVNAVDMQAKSYQYGKYGYGYGYKETRKQA